MFQTVLEAWGRVDILVNNAAWASPRAHILEMDEEHWDTVIRTNLKSVYLHCHRAANIMVDQGIRGSIVNISSFAAARAHRYMAAYDATKGGMEAMTRTMALDLAPFGIRLNVVGPGAIHTEEYEPEGEEARRQRGQTVPLGRVGYPEDIAGAVAFLASDDASYITGQVLYVDGGMLAQLRSPQVDAPLPDSVQARLRPRSD
jgi:3-oxoacyl-[acyl-carrier protein] reductase